MRCRTVNPQVPGSSPGRGAKNQDVTISCRVARFAEFSPLEKIRCSPTEKKSKLITGVTRRTSAPGPLLLPNILNKMHDAESVRRVLPRLPASLYRGRVLELGGRAGVGVMPGETHGARWRTSSATDISPYAIASLPHWERLWSVKVDHVLCMPGNLDTRNCTGSVDLVWCFASAHHFDDMPAALSDELRRDRAADRRCRCSCMSQRRRRYLYRLQKWRANRIRPAVPEDVLVRLGAARASARRWLSASTIHDCLSGARTRGRWRPRRTTAPCRPCRQL
jgi:SAM-dependent methyltransferase